VNDVNGKQLVSGIDALTNLGKEYFKCDSITGLPLENNGGAGT
jgi:hypothetical protein